MEPPDVPAPDDGTDRDPPEGEYVLYPIFASHDSRTFEIARDIAEGADATLFVLDLYDQAEEFTEDSRRISRELLDSELDESHDVTAETRFERTDDPVEAVVDTAQARETVLIVFDEHTPDTLTGDVPDRISDQVPCDVVSVAHARGNRLASILVPIAGGPHSGLAVSIAGAIGRSTSSAVDLFHVPEPDETDEEIETLFERARERLPADVAVDTWRLDAEDVADAIIEQSSHYDLTVVGEPKKGRLRRFLFGSVTDEVSDDSRNTVLVARGSDGHSFEL